MPKEHLTTKARGPRITKRKKLLMEQIEDRILCSAAPNVALSAPAAAKIGESVSVTATFDNTAGTNAGYGPYIDVLADKTGADGNDGLTFQNASLLGVGLTSTVLTFQAADAGHPTGPYVVHPYAKDASGNPVTVYAPSGYGVGDQLIVLQLPFGSFSPQQPPAPVTMNFAMSNLADVNTPLNLSARGGFQYGNDALDNSATDPSIVDPSFANASVTPSLFTLTKTYLGPENETATGPNFLRQYQIDVDIAAGQTISSLQLTDLLPSNMQFFTDATHLVEVLKNGVATGSTSTSTPSTTTPGGTLTRTLTTSVTGDASTAPDATLRFWYYVPRIDSGSGVIINAVSGDDATSQNNASTAGNWNPIDPRDGTAIPVSINVAGPEHILTPKSIATQKTVAIVNDTGAVGATPGDTLEYTIQIQVSDYFAFQNLILTDLFSDGQRLDGTFTPTFSFNEHATVNGAANFNAANYTVFLNADNNPATPATDGSTTLTFNLSSEMISRGFDAKLIGGGIPNAGTGAGPLPNNPALPFGATTATIKFRTIIQDKFSDTFPSGDAAVNARDVLTNNVNINGDLLQVNDVTTPTGQSEADTSAATVAVVNTSVLKTIYAVNGAAPVIGANGKVLIAPGDDVTYRLQFTVPTGDVENLVLTDYLPLPIFDATSVTTFQDVISAAAPAAGFAKFGPSETMRPVHGSAPTISAVAAQNTLAINYGTTDDPTNSPRTVDVLFTVKASSQPFADGLFLTNQVRVSENNTQQPAISVVSDAIIQVQLQEPTVVAIQKGVVGYNTTGLTLGGIVFTDPSAASNFSGGIISNSTQAAAIGASNLLGLVDAGDKVRYGIVLQNSGSGDAFDVAISDTIQSDYVIPGTIAGLNLTVRHGDGTLVNPADYTTTYNSGTGAFTVAFTDNYTAGNTGAGDAKSGSLSRGLDAQAGTAVTNGSNTVVVTYDLTLKTSTPQTRETITNTAALTNYAGSEGGTDFTTTDPTDTALVQLVSPTVAKVLTGTEVNNATNSATQAVVGELATYTLTITVPDGTTANASILDTLDAGLAFVDVTGVALSGGVSTANSIGLGTAPANVTVGGSGTTLNFNFGNIVNSNNTGGAETVTITYRAVVLDTLANQAGVQLNNSAVFSAQTTDQPSGTTTPYSLAAVSANNLTIIEPTLNVAKGVSSVIGGPFTASLANVDAGDSVFYQIQVTNLAGQPTAFDLFLNDTLPAALTGLSIASVSATGFTAAPVSADFQIVGGILGINAGGPRAGKIDVDGGATLTIVVQGTLASTVQPAQTLNNNATVRWTSMNGAVGTRSVYDASSTERSGGSLTPASGVNASTNNAILDNYAATSGTAAVTILSPAPTKTIDSTSESSTTNVAGTERVAIGEIVRYRLTWQIPEGTSNNLQFADNLPAGMQFLNDGTATLAFVSSGGNISSSIFGTTASVTGDEGTVGSINPQFVIPGAQITGGPFTSGTHPVFNLGNVVNPDSDASQEFAVIEFNAVVMNVTGNQAFDNSTGAANGPTTLSNTVSVTTATSAQTSAGVNVQVAEPAITGVSKTASPGPYDAGNPVTYTVTFSNLNSTNASTAFDLTMTDVLPAFLSGVTFGSVTSTGSVTGLLGGAAGNTITVNAASMAPGATITVTYTATLGATVPAGQIVTNTANVVYSSLSLSGTALNDGVAATVDSTPGAAGTATGERTGAGGIGTDGTVLNNYANAGSRSITIATPTLDKTFKDGSLTADDTSVASTSGASVVVGEQVTYDILVTLPEGVTQSLNVTDAVPAGMRVDGFQILTTAASAPLLSADFNGSFTTTPATSTFTGPGNLTLSFGNTTVVNDNVSGNNSFVIRVRATVLNIVTNQATVTRTNTATLSYTNPNTATTVNVTDSNTGNDPAVTVVEPAIVTNKSVSSPTPDNGDPITYTITLSNTSGQTAYDAALSDVLPTALVGYSIASVNSSGTVFVNGVATPVTSSDTTISGGTLQFAAGSNIDMATGSTITITVTGTVAGTATPNQLVTNTATTTWTSTDGANADERSGTDGVGGALNDYASSGSVNFTVPQASFAKQFFSSSQASTTGTNVTIGETVTYALIVTLPEGTTPGLNVTDLLPSGLQYVSSSVVTTAASSGGLLSADFGGTVPAPAISGGVANGDDVSYTFGSISVTGDNVVANNKFLIFVTALVLDVPANSGVNPPGQTTLPNAATFDVLGDGVSPFTTPNVNVTVVEPKMVIAKTMNPGAGDAGDTVTVTLTVQNTGTSDAFDVTVNDPFPAGKFTSFTPVTTPGGFTFGAAGDTVTFTGGTIVAGGTATFTFTAVLTSAVQPTEVLSNTASVTKATTLPGVDTNERNTTATSNTVTTTVPAATLTKTLFATSEASTAGSNVTIGETVTYALKVTLPEGTTPNLTLVDLLPAGLQYVSSSLVTTAAASNGLLGADFAGTVGAPVRSGTTGNGDDQTFTFGSISVTGDNAAGTNSFLVLVTAQVLDVAGNVGLNPPGQTVLPNTATLDITGDTAGPVTTPAVNVTVVEPKMVIAKNIDLPTADAGDTVTVTLTVQNTGTSDAFDVIVNDPFPAGKFTSFTPVTTPGGFTFGSAGDTVTFSGGTISAGGTATFTFTAVLTSAVAPGEVLNNTASVTQATTLPGTVVGERTEPIVSGSDSVAVPVGTYAKSVFSTSDSNTAGTSVGIGETVTYALKVTLPEGTTSNLSIVDLLPAGLQYVSHSVFTTAAGSGGLLAADFAGNISAPVRTGTTGDGDDQTFSFATIDVTNDNAANNNSFLLLVTARVTDVVGNAGTVGSQTVLNNRATFDIPTDGVPPTTTPDVPVTVVEPRLQITKGVSDNTPDAGQTLTYTLNISHTASSTAIAYDVLLRDAIPAGITLDTASIQINGVAVGSSPLVDSNSSTGSLLDLKFTELALGGTITVTYSATVSTNPAVAGTNLDNNARIYWDTDAAEDPNAVLTGTPDGTPDRDLGAVPGVEVFNVDTDPAQDTERVTVNSSTLSGFVYADANADGALNGADTGIVGVTVTLTGTDVNGNTINRTTLTGAGGAYSFTGLTAGAYTITETQAAGYLDGIETVGTTYGGAKNDALGTDAITGVTVPVGNNSGVGYNFGEVLSSSVSGFTYVDANNDGTKQGGETGLGTGVPVRITGTDIFGQAVSLTATTDPVTGAYSFTGLRPSNGAGYTITEDDSAVVPVTYFDGRDTAGSLGGIVVGAGPKFDAINVTLGQNQAGTSYNFGEIVSSNLSGNVYADLNNNGTFDAFEKGIAGVTVTLTGFDDQGSAVNVTVVTDSAGGYSFANIRPSGVAGYTITETQPGDYADGKDTIGTPGGNSSVNDVFSAVILAAGTSGTNNNFGELPIFALTKTLVNTSEPGTTGNNVAVGEVATFRLVVTVPTGSLTNFQVRDFLPAGYQYLNGTARAGLVSSSGQLTSGTLSGAGLALTSVAAPTFVLPDSAVSDNVATNSDAYVSGTDVYFKLGNLVNTDTTGATEAVVIEFDARVVNELANVGGNTLTNTFGILYDADGVGDPDPDPTPSNSVPTTVVSPVLTFAKAATPTGSVNAGDQITYTLTITNPAGANRSTAFDALVTDTMPPDILITSITSVITTPGTTTDSAVTITGGGAGLTGQFDVAVGGSVTITYVGTVQVTAPTGVAETNNATLTWTSINGGNSNTPDTGERFGAPGTIFGDGNLNNFRLVDSKTVTIAQASFAKQLFSTSEAATTGGNVAVGENVTYALIVRVPAGTTPSLSITDALPNGLQFVSSSVVTTVAGSGGLLVADFNGTVPVPTVTGGATDGADVNFDFGTIVGNADGSLNSTNNTFVVLITARVTDVVGNSGTAGGQTVLPNTATFDIPGDSVPPTTTPPVDVTVVEPKLQITKAVDDATPDINQILTYTLTLDHQAASTADAFDVRVLDLIPQGLGTGLTLDPASILVNGVAIGSSPRVTANATSGNQIDFTLDQVGLAETITITYQVRVVNTLVNAGTLTSPNTYDNNARIYWDNLAGDEANNSVFNNNTPDGTPDRDYGATPGLIEAPAASVDPAQDSTRVTVNSNTISGVVYRDVNTSGAFEDGVDQRLDNVTVTLTGTTASGLPVSITQVTVNGNYSFVGLPAGTYVITETQPAGLTDALETVGTNFGGAISPSLDSNTISAITIPAQSNTTGVSYNFGEVTPASIAGSVYHDADNDGVRDATEIGLTSSIQLTGTDVYGQAVNITLPTTGGGVAAGTFLFDNAGFGLRPGSYTLTQITQPAGYLDGKDTAGTSNGTADSVTSVISAIPLAQGANATDYVFGELLPASISGTVYSDANDDGTVDPGEVRIQGVTVTLTGTDDRGNPVNASTVTLADGTYSFTSLRPGTYTVTETQPATYSDGKETLGTIGGSAAVNDVFSNITTTSGDVGTGYNFGERSSVVSGTVFRDANRDGAIQPGDTGLGGVTVNLLDSLGAVIATTTTNPDGTYQFSGIAAGVYSIQEIQPVGYGSSTPNTIASVTVPVGGLTNQNFGETTSTLSGRVFLDAGNDGGFDVGTDSGIGGVTVLLTGTDASGAPVSVTTTTNSNGTYSFGNLLSGTYAVTETQPSNFDDGIDTAGSLLGTVANDFISNIVMPVATDAVNYTFAEIVPPTPPGKGAVQGTVFRDGNRDGAIQTGDTGIGGVTLELLDSNGNVVGTTTTAPDGGYSFTNITPGTYSIRETQPNGYGSSTPNTISGISIVADKTVVNQNFGETTAGLAGTVFTDLDRDGVFTVGEPGIAGVTLTLTGTDVNGASVTATTVTDSSGNYSFDGLLAGTYRIVETQPANRADGLDKVGTSGGTAGNDDLSNIALSAGTQATSYNFGELLPTISGTVFRDDNVSGAQNGTEPGLGTVTLTLLDSLGNVVATTTTNPDGTYAFTNVLPGTYSIVETQPLGYGSSTPNSISNISVPVGGVTNQNFGETTGSLSGTVYHDKDLSGTLNGGDSGIGGATVRLTGTDAQGNAIDITTTTNPDGTYTFTGLLGGTYQIDETQPTGYSDGAENIGTSGGDGNVNDRFADIGLGGGINATGYNFGELLITPPGTGAVAGTVWLDRNRDGALQAGENGVGSVTLQLLDSTNTVVATTTTGPDGRYVFNNVAPGTYTVAETQPAGYGSSTPNTIGTVSVVADAVTDNNNFGETLGSLAGTVYRDANNDGVKLGAAETGIAGVTLTLTGTDINGNPVSRTTVTDSDGNYRFTDLVASNAAGYTVTETQPATFNDGLDAVGTAGTTLGNDVLSGAQIVVGGDNVTDATGYNFGERGTTLSGTVWVDRNRDGVIQPATESAGVSGVLITLLDSKGNVVATTNTDSNGAYSFGNLEAGNYSIVETQPNGYGSSTANIINATVPVAGLTSQNFGETLSTIAGKVFRDDAQDSTFNGPDRGIEGVQIRLTGTDATGAPVNLVTTTDASGNYRFADLLAGNYTVTETQPADYRDFTDQAGSAGGLNLVNDTLSSIGLGAAVDATDYTFAEIFRYDPTKTVVSTNNPGTSGNLLSIGETVRYRLTVAVPDGTLNDFVLQEFLPDGLTFLNDGTASVAFFSGSGTAVTSTTLGGGGLGVTDFAATPTVLLSDAQISSSLAANEDVYVSGTDVYFKLGNITNTETAPGDPEREFVILEFNAKAVNEPANRIGRTMDNVFVPRFDLTGDSISDPLPKDITSDPVRTVVAEPVLSIDKQLTVGSTVPRQGDVLTFSVTITHATGSNATAWEANFADTLPAGLELQSIATSATGGAVISKPATSVGQVLSGQFDIPVGGQIVITYQVKVNVRPGIGQTLVNGAGVTWTSMPGDVVGERHGGDSLYGRGGLNDYGQRDELTLKPFSFSFDSFNNFASMTRPGVEEYGIHSPEQYRLPLLPLAPIYSGEADPGSTLVVTLYNTKGDIIGSQTVLVDAGGNWMANFPSTIIYDYPNSVQITESSSFFSLSDPFGHNLRTYFSPALNAGHFFFAEVKHISEANPAPLLGDLGLASPISLSSVKYGGELLGTQGAPAGY